MSQFQTYLVIAAAGVTLPATTLVQLTEKQFAARAHLVTQVAEGDKISHHVAKAPLSFKRGETITVAGDMPKAFLEQIATPGAAVSVAQERAAAKAEKTAGRGKGRGKAPADKLV